MKKRYVIIGLLAASLTARAQKTDTVFVKRKLPRTDVELILGYYTQDNNHSAVTGGIGTEDLQVYSNRLRISVQTDSVNTFGVDAGIDLISSASTDKIDFVTSSASILDARTYVTGYYERNLKKRFRAGGKWGFSIESDYLSLWSGFSIAKVSRDLTREWSLDGEVFFDDLRWGRLNGDVDELKLVYPFELRNQEWFDLYRRNSYNLSAGFLQAINRRMSIGVYPGIVYQRGLLSTPFHRVYFSDDSERVENLPTSRIKFPVGVQFNTFVGGRTIIKLYYRYYSDSFGITAHTGSFELPLKISRSLIIGPSIRYYRQQEAEYFRPYKEHDPAQEYYTSDYDLSEFTSVQSGIGIRYAPFSGQGRSVFNAVEVRYQHYQRSDGLTANMITLLIGYSVFAK